MEESEFKDRLVYIVNSRQTGLHSEAVFKKCKQKLSVIILNFTSKNIALWVLQVVKTKV